MRSINQIVVEGVLTDAGLSLDAVPQILRAIDRATTNGYDLDENEALQLIYEQGAVCAICKSPFDPAVAPIVEHRHEDEELGRTHLVRGFVCPTCNARAKNYDGVEAHSGKVLPSTPELVWWTEYNQRPAQRKAETQARRSGGGKKMLYDLLATPKAQRNAEVLSMAHPTQVNVGKVRAPSVNEAACGYLKAVGRINTLLNINDARARQLVEEYQKLLDSLPE